MLLSRLSLSTSRLVVYINYRISVEGGDINLSSASFLSCNLTVMSEFITVTNTLTPKTVNNPSRMILISSTLLIHLVHHILQRAHHIGRLSLVSYTVD